MWKSMVEQVFRLKLGVYLVFRNRPSRDISQPVSLFCTCYLQ